MPVVHFKCQCRVQRTRQSKYCASEREILPVRLRKKTNSSIRISRSFLVGMNEENKKNDCLFYANAIKIQMAGIRFLVRTSYMRQSVCSKHYRISRYPCYHVLISSRHFPAFEDVPATGECVRVRVCVCGFVEREHKMNNNKNGMKQILYITRHTATIHLVRRRNKRIDQQRRWPTSKRMGEKYAMLRWRKKLRPTQS